jgi:hypothetical protein
VSRDLLTFLRKADDQDRLVPLFMKNPEDDQRPDQAPGSMPADSEKLVGGSAHAPRWVALECGLSARCQATDELRQGVPSQTELHDHIGAKDPECKARLGQQGHSIFWFRHFEPRRRSRPPSHRAPR